MKAYFTEVPGKVRSGLFYDGQLLCLLGQLPFEPRALFGQRLFALGSVLCLMLLAFPAIKL